MLFADVTRFASPEPVAPPLEAKSRCDKFNMIENKRAYVKKEVKVEQRTEALYTVTSNRCARSLWLILVEEPVARRSIKEGQNLLLSK